LPPLDFVAASCLTNPMPVLSLCTTMETVIPPWLEVTVISELP
jgi:hypothetical protein